MGTSFFVLANRRWITSHGRHSQRLAEGCCPVGVAMGRLVDGCRLLVKYRDSTNKIVADADAELVVRDGEAFVKSPRLAARVSAPEVQPLLLFWFEGSYDQGRCIVRNVKLDDLTALEDAGRLSLLDIPPAATTLIESGQFFALLNSSEAERDTELYSVHADRFLRAPNIITALFAHLQTVRAEDNIRFPVQLKTLADQIRALLSERESEPTIRRIQKSHLDLWAEAQGMPFAFLDGGAARISALPGMSPIALRVGVYTVRPGVAPEEGRELFRMRPFVVGDALAREPRPEERPDPRRLQEAARYTFEAVAGMMHLQEFPGTRALFMHGPLVNQFVEYDEGKPHYIPFLDEAFLASVGVERRAVVEAIRLIPPDMRNVPMWNQFMAVYAYVMRRLNESTVPVLGVVERPVGRSVTLGLLRDLERVGAVTPAYRKRVNDLLEEYDITDDFLFGCILREGEYLTPVSVSKNPRHKARERWWPVVDQLPKPKSMLLKSEDTTFPFRVEMNIAAAAQSEFLARFLYHTARLLPRYAFPVGLDIADKYAKIPDWLSRGVSAEFSATVLRKAMDTGDARLVAAIRHFLAHSPRDFFYRPSP